MKSNSFMSQLNKPGAFYWAPKRTNDVIIFQYQFCSDRIALTLLISIKSLFKPFSQISSHFFHVNLFFEIVMVMIN